MLNKHINRVRSGLESKFSTKENKIEFTHKLSYTCNNRLYYIFDYTDANGEAKSLFSGGYSDVGFDSDSAVCELDFNLCDKIGMVEAAAIIQATAQIESELMQRVKAPKKVSEKYEIDTYASQIPTINALLSDVSQELSAEDLNQVEPFVISMVLPNQEAADDALKIFSDLYEQTDFERRNNDTLQGVCFANKQDAAEPHTILNVSCSECSDEDFDPIASFLEECDDDNLKAKLKADGKKLLTCELRSDALFTLNEVKDLVKSLLFVGSQMQADDLLGVNVNGEFFPTSEFVSLGTELIESNHWPENFLTGVVATKDDQDDSVEDKGMHSRIFTGEYTIRATGLSALGFSDVVHEAVLESEADSDLWFSMLNAINDTFLNSGFIIAEDAPLVVNLKDTHIYLEDKGDHLKVCNIRNLK